MRAKPFRKTFTFGRANHATLIEDDVLDGAGHAKFFEVAAVVAAVGLVKRLHQSLLRLATVSTFLLIVRRRRRRLSIGAIVERAVLEFGFAAARLVHERGVARLGDRTTEVGQGRRPPTEPITVVAVPPAF